MVTQTTLAPDRCIVPIVIHNVDGSCGPFLGPGFFLNEPSALITCAHVLRKGCNHAVISRDYPGKLFSTKVARLDAKSDLACLLVEKYKPPQALDLAKDEDIILNEMVCCFEYGTTLVAGKKIDFAPSSRMGNVTRVRDLTNQFNTAGDHMLELSFPALLGASGAPVMASKAPYSVWGVVSTNYARELMPAQIEQIANEQGVVTEETKFYLPQALAIHVRHVRDLVSGMS